MIFLQRPVALVLMAVSAALLILSAVSYLSKRRDWRSKLVEAEAIKRSD
jgi:TctA family transporter